MTRQSSNSEQPSSLFNVDQIRKDFPVLNSHVHGHQLVYLDNAATSQKPRSVIDAISDYYTNYNANIHRGVHSLSQKASDLYDEARSKTRQFINASSDQEIIFTGGTTHSINLVAYSFGRKYLSKGDEIILTELEHHANIVPWQIICEEKGAIIKVCPVKDDGLIDLDELEKLFSDKTKLLSFAYISNALGVKNPVKEIIQKAHAHDVQVLVDGAQAIIHDFVDVRDLNCDFFSFSSHKMLGPTGLGVLYGKKKILEQMPPFLGGGDMIESVSFEGTSYNDLPYKFEAGTPHIAGVIGFGAALDYWYKIDREAAFDHERKLFEYAHDKLSTIEGIKIFSDRTYGTAVLSFVFDGINALDVGLFLDTEGIAVRTGQHCAEPLMDRLNVNGTIRASFMFYNTFDEVDRLYDSLVKALGLLRK